MIARTTIDPRSINPVVTWRFDDGSNLVYNYVYQLFRQYGVCGSLCMSSLHIVDSDTPQAEGGYLIPAQVVEMLRAGWTILPHVPHSSVLLTSAWGNGFDTNPPNGAGVSLAARMTSEWEALRSIINNRTGYDIGGLAGNYIVYPSHRADAGLIPAMLSLGLKGGTSPTGGGTLSTNLQSAASNWISSGDTTWRACNTRLDFIARVATTRRWVADASNSVSDWHDFAKIIAGRKAVICLAGHARADYSVDIINNATAFDAANRPTILAMWRTWIEYLINAGAIFLTLDKYLDYIYSPVCPHLYAPFRDLCTDKAEHIMTSGTSPTGFVVEPTVTCPSGYPVITVASSDLAIPLSDIRTRWYLVRLWMWGHVDNAGTYIRSYVMDGSGGGPQIANISVAHDGSGSWKHYDIWIDSTHSPASELWIYLRHNAGSPYYSKPECIEMPVGAKTGDSITLPDGSIVVVGTNTP